MAKRQTALSSKVRDRFNCQLADSRASDCRSRLALGVPAAEDVGKCRGEEDLGFGLDIAAVSQAECVADPG